MKLVNVSPILTLLLISVLAVSAFAADYTITQSGITVSPDDLTITASESVEWVWTGGFHTVPNEQETWSAVKTLYL